MDVIERSDELWSGASATNEGKVHLGAVFALGTSATHDVMLRGALAFAPAVEDAVGRRVNWDDIAGDEFDHLVMPDSLIDADDLGHAYQAINDRLVDIASPGDTYLGHAIKSVADKTTSRDPDTGLPRFRTQERAVDPLRLRAIVLSAFAENPRTHAVCSTEATTISTTDRSATVEWDGTATEYDAVINAAWAWQNRFSTMPTRRNFRVKAAVRLPAGAARRTVTIVQGPYGDVVAHRDYGYASWYPVGRLINEQGLLPSADAESAITDTFRRYDLVRGQLDALADLGLLATGLDGDPIGGIIVGEGSPDIDDPASLLHQRSEFGCAVRGRVITPVSFKLTTAPLAARLASATVEGLS